MKKNLHPQFVPMSIVYVEAFLILGILFFIGVPSTIAATKTWVPTTGGSWTTSTNWSPSGAPAAGDDVVIPADQSNDITSIPAIALNSLTIGGNCTFATAGDLTISINTTFDVDASKTLTLKGSAGKKPKITLAATATGQINGIVTGENSSNSFTNNGTLIMAPAGVIKGIGSFTNSAGATLKIGSTAGITISGSSGNIQTSNRTYATGANYEYNGTAAQVTGNGLTDNTPQNLTINNNAGVTLSAATNISGKLTIISGAILKLQTFSSTAKYLYFDDIQQVVGAWGSTSSSATNKNSTYFGSTGTGTLNITGATYYSIATGNWDSNTTWSFTSGGTSVGAGLFPRAGDVVNIEGGDVVTVTADAACTKLTFTNTGATLTVNSEITLAVSGAVTGTSSASSIYSNTTTGGGTLTCAFFNVGSNIKPSSDRTTTLTSSINNLTISENLVLYSSDDGFDQNNAIFNLSSGTVTVNGSIVSTKEDSGQNTSTLNLATGSQNGTLILGGATPFSLGAGTNTITLSGTSTTVSYNYSGNQTVYATTYNNLTLGGSGAKTTTGSTVNGVLSLEGTATVAGTIPTYGANITLQYKGSATQTTGIELPTAGIANLTINNAANVNASRNITVTGSLIFIAGTLNMGTYSLSANENIEYNGSTVQEVPAGNYSTLKISNTAGAIINGNLTAATLTISPSSILTVAAGKALTVSNSLTNNGTLNLLSTNSDGTATILTPASTGGTGSFNVDQHLASGRNWYISSPVSAATVTALNSANYVSSYNEPGANWVTETGTLTPMKGYISVGTNITGAVTFNGSLNTGEKSIILTRTTGVTKEGFNLVGNPYAAYLNWDLVAKDALETNTIWYRTVEGSTYKYYTYNPTGGSGGISVPGTIVTNLIPPMQAFWVRAKAGGGTLTVNSNMCSHRDNIENKFKAPATKNATQQVLRLQVSNGTNSDEAVIYFNPNASNSFDNYDSPKMFNNNVAIPEIYTKVGSELLVINGMKELPFDVEIPLGFNPGKAANFSIKATELRNFDSSIKIKLLDKLNTYDPEQDLTPGTPYTFSSDATNTSSRFSIIFRAAGVTTGLSVANSDTQVSIYQNTNHRIVVTLNEPITKPYVISVLNSLGQRLASYPANSARTELNTTFNPGTYFVVTEINGNKVIRKVVLTHE